MALIELGRFDEAIVAEKKALRQNPSFTPAYRCLASAFAHLGRDAEAREAAARVLEDDPAFTISEWTARGGQSNSKLLIEGLRKAGLVPPFRGGSPRDRFFQTRRHIGLLTVPSDT